MTFGYRVSLVTGFIKVLTVNSETFPLKEVLVLTLLCLSREFFDWDGS